VAQLEDVEATGALRIALGGTLSRLKQLAPLALALFPVLHLPCAVPLCCSTAVEDDEPVATSEMDANAMSNMSDKLHSLVQQWKLEGCHEWPPLLDGKQVRLHAASQ
jgi:hypothetical protein